MMRTSMAGVVILLLIPLSLAAESSDSCTDVTDLAEKTVVFDHLDGNVLAPTPTLMELRDGEVFDIRFCNTLPSRFLYEISPIEPDKEGKTTFDPGTGRAEVEREHLTAFSLSWKHREEFSLYKVSVTVRPGVANPAVERSLAQVYNKLDRSQRDAVSDYLNLDNVTDFSTLQQGRRPEEIEAALEAQGVPGTDDPLYLYSYTFPVWVRTASWKLSFTSGVSFSDLQDDKFFLETDDKGTEATEDDTQLVRRDDEGVGDSRPDIAAFVNLVTPEAGWWNNEGWRRWLGGRAGLAFGVGLSGEDGDPRYYFGPSWTIGWKDHLVIMAGWTGGEVDRLPPGQVPNEPPIHENVVNELDSAFEHGFFAGLSFSFNPAKKQDFQSALNGKAGRTDTGGTEADSGE